LTPASTFGDRDGCHRARSLGNANRTADGRARTRPSSVSSAGIELHTLDMRRGVADLRAIMGPTRALRQVGLDILQTWLYHADLLGSLVQRLAPPCALFWNIRCTETLETDIVRNLLIWFSTRPDVVIVNSLAGQRFHEQLGYRPRRWAHIPNG
jgi:hypothetical protein